MSTERPAAMEPSGAEECKDGIQAVIDDHRGMEALFKDYHATRPEDHQQKLTVARELVTHVSQHASAEERLVYPLIPKVVPPERDAKMLYDMMVSDDQVNKDLLHFLDTHEPHSDEEWRVFDMVFDRFMKIEEEHFAHEERVVFPELQRLLSADQKADLYHQWQRVVTCAPRHPHPGLAMSHGPVAKVAHPVAGVVDKAAQLASGLVGMVIHGHDSTGKAVLEGHHKGQHTGPSSTVGQPAAPGVTGSVPETTGTGAGAGR